MQRQLFHFSLQAMTFYYATYPNSQQRHHLQSPFETGPEHVGSSHPSGNRKQLLSPNIFVIKSNQEDFKEKNGIINNNREGYEP